ncbi:MAG: glutamate 5-kinase [Pirellulaceae bacterium]|nr:glutamate 5-kinase [Pirellulaceae bacterium]
MRIVVKLGTSTLTSGTKRLQRAVMVELARQVQELRSAGHQVIVVTSGAIAAGREKMAGVEAADKSNPSSTSEPKKKDETLVDKQVLAALGQVYLMSVWQSLFEIHNTLVGQMLLTRADLEHRERFLNARDTLLGLLAANVVPIINENDAVATAEIKVGDNDNLSARVALLANADLLIMLTDQPGLMTADPTRDPTATLLREIENIDAGLHAIAGGSVSGLGTGGMATKLQAAQIARQSAVEVVIAGVKQSNVLVKLVAGGGDGTRIRALGSRLESRKRWLLSGPQSQGRIELDQGACEAVRANKKSLLAKGIVRCDGEFERGDAVRMVDPNGHPVGVGLVRYHSTELSEILGRHSEDIQAVLGYSVGGVVIHRDELIVFG